MGNAVVVPQVTTPNIQTSSSNLNPSNKNLERPLLNLDQVTQTEVFKLSEQLNVNKLSGIDTINAQVIKDSLLTLNGQFTDMINTSISTSTFPNDRKKAEVVPIPKGGTPTDVGNYRPISLLPAPGKILDKIVHKQMEDFVEEGELITNNQFGFRKNRSTLQATSQLIGHNQLHYEYWSSHNCPFYRLQESL